MILDVRLDGFGAPIGELAADDRGAVTFTYTGEHLERADALALSLALPLTPQPFADVATRAYFDNLLQERDTARADIIAKYGLANDDIAGILYHLGKDCSGAVSVLPEGAPAVKVPGVLSRDYEPYADAQLESIVRSLHERRPLPEEVQDPSPLAGVQSKIAVTVLPDGRMAAPLGGAPTTHILKVPQERHEREAAREHRAMVLSRESGFETAATGLMEIAGIPALLVERYDRVVEGGRVRRIHQEDFCQALGLPARLKYERRGTQGRRFDVAAVRTILDRTIDPVRERQLFIDITIFDMLIGNADAHAKNFSLFHLPGNRIRTTPRYDVLPTVLDRGTTDEFAYRIGNAEALAQVDARALDDFLAELGLSSIAGRRRILQEATDRAVRTLNGQLGEIARHDKNFGDLIATNIRTLCDNLGLEVPGPARDMDTFVR
ncbi:hypothetical protein VE25_08620 [Devosia geojensis]|uniref:Phosphatidylinositol kinase n=1 Tax=Devosia geojensis TaxID=443610 RepID=A0A0F5FVC3_9HYPH|nr:HipA domain-containing protein [Devosia geojensis]KKB12117.1 hypothetical protein VE25_08620 [Devosia geojensis]